MWIYLLTIPSRLVGGYVSRYPPVDVNTYWWRGGYHLIQRPPAYLNYHRNIQRPSGEVSEGVKYALEASRRSEDRKKARSKRFASRTANEPIIVAKSARSSQESACRRTTGTDHLFVCCYLFAMMIVRCWFCFVW